MRTLNRLLRPFRFHPRLGLATALGVATFLVAPPGLRGVTRVLVAWDTCAVVYLALAWAMMFRSDLERHRWRARMQDDGAAAVLALTVFAALASLGAIVLELVGMKGYAPASNSLHVVLASVTVLSSWCIVHTAFTLHYAKAFYNERPASTQPALQFPGTSEPVYIDFLYFSFVIGMTAQTSDVNITSRAMRRLVLTHGVISFFFNTTLLAMLVNISVSLG
jgi:uncharacterized membrane protein